MPLPTDPPRAADGSAVTVETRQGDLTRLDPDDLAGATLITASALLDMLTAAELERFARSCVAAAVPALVTLSVTGRVRLTPSDPLDTALGTAFNRHQRRTVGRSHPARAGRRPRRRRHVRRARGPGRGATEPVAAGRRLPAR